jgi:hypothetical protein
LLAFLNFDFLTNQQKSAQKSQAVSKGSIQKSP